MTEEAVTPAAAPAAPAAPEASKPAASAAPVVKPADTSLVDDAAPAAEDPAAVKPEAAKWYLSDGVAGQGEAPDWFKADKYKSVDEQAKAYLELEKRFGSFTGAPKDGVYKINPPEGIQVEFDTEHELFQGLNKWAKESNLSQAGYDQVIGMLAQYEASMAPDMGEIKKQVGENADARISSVNQWAKSNLTEDQYKAFRSAQTQSNAADVFKAFEAVIAKTRQVPMPKPGEDVTAATNTGLESIRALHRKKNEKGELLYDVDSQHRAKVEKMYQDFAASQQAA